MKKRYFIVIIVVILLGCNRHATSVNTGTIYKARFEIAALCSNYTFSIVAGNIDTSFVEAKWANPQTNKTYSNAFGIGNPCDLPKTLKEGDIFNFEIITPEKNDCMVCMAYYPTPSKKLYIKVIQ